MEKIERFVTLLSEGGENEYKLRLGLTDCTLWIPQDVDEAFFTRCAAENQSFGEPGKVIKKIWIL